MQHTRADVYVSQAHLCKRFGKTRLVLHVPELESVLMIIISLLLLCNAQRPISLTDDLALRHFAHNQAENGGNTSNATYLEIACMDQDQTGL